jgi:hypothetical protein
MRFTSKLWINRQVQRIRRVIALGPYVIQSPRRMLSLTRRMGLMVFYHALEGVKSFCKDLEAEKRAALAGPAARAMAAEIRGPAGKRPAERGYVIFAPTFTPNSAGICCLYRLCDELNRRGYPSYIIGSTRTAPNLIAPLESWGRAERLCAAGYTAVYPETIAGNPLGAHAVARWVLNRPGLLGGDPVYDESEMVFYYSDVFLPYIKNRTAGKLYMPTINQELFFCDDWDPSRRSLECFYVGKSKWQDGIIDREKVFEITRDTPPKSELGKLFRSSRVLYCFDNSTILVYEALMCGCPVVIIPDGTQTKADYERLELGIDGIAWGMDELSQVTADVRKLHDRYERIKKEYRSQLGEFVAVTQRGALDRSSVRRAA